jgi:hypothetical protein
MVRNMVTLQDHRTPAIYSSATAKKSLSVISSKANFPQHRAQGVEEAVENSHKHQFTFIEADNRTEIEIDATFIDHWHPFQKGNFTIHPMCLVANVHSKGPCSLTLG